MLGSKSDYFFQDREALIKNRLKFSELLMNFEKDFKLIELYLEAYDYFMQNPHKFDGATASEDLKLKALGIDYRASLHDYLYIKGFNGCYELIDLANQLYYNEMKADGVSGVYIWWQKIRLSIISKPFVIYNILKGKELPSQRLINKVKELC